MTYFIPKFIIDNYQKNNTSGNFLAFTMFVDIYGFTHLTEKLMEKDIEGVEILSKIINDIFDPVINYIDQHNGYISTFAGDAFTAIFEENENISCEIILDVAMFIKNTFRKINLKEITGIDDNLNAKIGISWGNVEWGIIGTEEQKSFYYKGEAIENAALTEHCCKKGDIVFDSNFKAHKGFKKTITFDKISDNYFLFEEKKFKNISILNKDNFSENKDHFDNSLFNKFLPEIIFNTKQKGEFRNIISVFISYKETEGINIFEIIKKIIELNDLFGGYLNGFEFGDKGNTASVFFGMPLSYGNDLERGINFALVLKEIFPNNIRIGITFGNVYSGIIGNEKRAVYTALGKIVNLSARLMGSAEYGEILLSKDIKEKINQNYICKRKGYKKLKGFSENMLIYSLENKKEKIVKNIYENKFIGRKKEIKEITNFCKKQFDDNENGVIYIFGEAGSGKSRLIYEINKNYNFGYSFYFTQVDGILKQSLNPFIYFFKIFFDQNNSNSEAINKENFNKKFEQFIHKLKKFNENFIISQLEKFKYFLALLIGLNFEEKIFENISAKDKLENTYNVIKNFFKGLSIIKQTIILFEDIQWLDDDSKTLLVDLINSLKKYPIIFIFTVKVFEKEEKKFLKLRNNISSLVVDLNNLNSKETNELTKKLLNKKIDDNLLKFILDKTLGNPFYIEQFCLYLKENNLLELSNNVYSLKESNIEKIPSGIYSIIIARIDSLAVDIKELLQLASILGKEFEVDILVQLVKEYSKLLGENNNLFNKSLDNILSEVEKEKLLLLISSVRYSFKNTILRDIIYDMQLRTRVRELHKLAAETIEKKYKDDKYRFSEIAYHFYRAEEYKKAMDYYHKAAEFSKSYYKLDIALLEFDRAIDLCKRINGENSLFLADLYREKGSILEFKRLYKEALELYELSLKIRQNLNEDNNKISDTYRGIGNVMLFSGKYDEALEYYLKALDIKKVINKEEDLDVADYYMNIGVIYYYKGEYNLAYDYYQKALDIKLKLAGENNSGTAMIYNNIGNIFYAKGDFDLAYENYQKALNIKLKILYENHPDISNSYNNMGIIYLIKGNYEESLKYQNKALEIRLDIFGENHPQTAKSITNIGIIYYYMEKYNDAIDCFIKSMNIRSKFNDNSITQNYAYLAHVYTKLNKFEEALYYILLYFQKTQIIGKDLEYGFTHLAYAILLGKIKNIELTETIKKYLLEIKSITGLDENEDSYYQYALDISMKNEYYDTYIQVLYQYAKYNFYIGNRGKALNYLLEASNIAKKTGKTGELKIIKKIAEEFDFSI